MGVGVMATGHGVGAPCDGGVLINTSRMRGVRVDPEAQTARVEAGALWADVTSGEAAQGASTITQQLVKRMLLSDEQTYIRKLRELKRLYPDVKVKLFYRRDIERLAQRLRLKLAS